MQSEGLDHVTLRCRPEDLPPAFFYRNVLGLEEGRRPGFDFPGAWLYAGGRAVPHLAGSRRAEPPAGAPFERIALRFRGLRAELNFDMTDPAKAG